MFIESLLISLLFIAFILIVRKSRPVKDKQGKTLNNSNSNSPIELNSNETLTVATFNIQTGKSLTGKREINRSANAIKDVDLIGIQEVYAPSHLHALGLGTSQVQTLAKTGGFDWLLCATRTRWLREHRGNLLLSKLATSEWKILALPDKSGKSYRNMTVAKIEWQDQSFHFINTHLHTRDGRDEQLEIVLAEFDKYPTAILVGDFNSRPNTPQLVDLLKNEDVTDAIGSLKIDLNEENRIDWILTKGFKVHNTEMIEKGISDHPYYQTTVSFIE